MKKETKTDTKKVSKEKEKNNKKKIIIIGGIILLAIIIILIFWFNRRFVVTFKYNNGVDNKEVVVKYLDKIKDEDVVKDLKLDGYNFVGYFETYELKEEEIKKLNKDESLTDKICKKEFKLDTEKNKCVAKKAYDFEKEKIKKHTTIEALWSTVSFEIDPTAKEINEGDTFVITATVTGSEDTSVKWESKDLSIATVTENGEVKGIKEGKTVITATSNGIERKCEVVVKKEVKEQPKKEVKDEGTISLRATDQCIVGTDSVRVIASVSDNAIDKKINWTFPDCFTYDENDSGTEVVLKRFYGKNSCSDNEVTNPVIKASLNNGNNDSLTLTFEPMLSYEVYNGNNKVSPNSQGIYKYNDIKVVANQSVLFTANDVSGTNRIYSQTDTTANISGSCTVTIKTTCGQSKSFEVEYTVN